MFVATEQHAPGRRDGVGELQGCEEERLRWQMLMCKSPDTHLSSGQTFVNVQPHLLCVHNMANLARPGFALKIYVRTRLTEVMLVPPSLSLSSHSFAHTCTRVHSEAHTHTRAYKHFLLFSHPPLAFPSPTPSPSFSLSLWSVLPSSYPGWM